MTNRDEFAIGAVALGATLIVFHQPVGEWLGVAVRITADLVLLVVGFILAVVAALAKFNDRAWKWISKRLRIIP